MNNEFSIPQQERRDLDAPSEKIENIDPKGAFNLASAIVLNIMTSDNVYHSLRSKLDFIKHSRLFVALVDVMGYDVEKMRKSMETKLKNGVHACGGKKSKNGYQSASCSRCANRII